MSARKHLVLGLAVIAAIASAIGFGLEYFIADWGTFVGMLVFAAGTIYWALTVTIAESLASLTIKDVESLG